MTGQTQGLRVVGPDDAPPRPKKALTLAQAIAQNDYLAELCALRRVVSDAITSASTQPRDLAALTRRQIELTREIRNELIVQGQDDISRAIAVEDAPFDPGSV